MNQIDKKSLLALGLVTIVAIAALTRVMPHNWNFTPITAIALFTGAVFTKRRMGIALTLAVMLASDTILAFQHGFSYGFHTLMPLIYVAYAATVFIGSTVKKKNFLNISLTTIVGSVMFFVVSNLGVWALGSYGYSFDGLVRCFEMAVPFFRTSFIGDVLWVAVLFGSYALAGKFLPKTEGSIA